MSLMSACLCLVYACSHVCSSSRLSLISVGVLAHSCVYVFLLCAYMLSCECFAASQVLTAPQCLAALACWLSSTARCSSAMITAALGDLWCSTIPGARALGFFAASPMFGNGPCPSVSVPTSSTCPLPLPLLLYHTILLRQTWIGRWLAANGGHQCSFVLACLLACLLACSLACLCTCWACLLAYLLGLRVFLLSGLFAFDDCSINQLLNRLFDAVPLHFFLLWSRNWLGAQDESPHNNGVS